jgi:hypothetical protein
MTSWITIEEAAVLLATSTDNARKIASRRGWRRARIDRRMHYAMDDVLDTPRKGLLT